MTFETAQGDAEIIEYFNVELKEKLGEHDAGRAFSLAILDTEKSTLSFFDGEVLKARFSVKLQVTKDLLNEE